MRRTDTHSLTTVLSVLQSSACLSVGALHGVGTCASSVLLSVQQQTSHGTVRVYERCSTTHGLMVTLLTALLVKSPVAREQARTQQGGVASTCCGRG